MTLLEMQQRRAQLAAEMRSHHESVGDNDWTGEQRSKWEAMRAEHAGLVDKIAREEELRGLDQAELEARDRGQGDRQHATPQDEQRAAAFDGFLRNGLGDLSPEYRAIMQEMRAQAAGTPAAGGYTVARTMQTRVVESLVSFGGIASVAQLLNTDNGAPIDWAVANGASEEGELLGENGEAGTGDVEFGNGTLGAHLLSSKVIRVSETLLADSGVDLEAFLARRIASRLGRTRARLIVKGSGAGNPLQPTGLERAAGVGKTTASATGFTWQEINALIHSVDEAYRQSLKFRLAMNDTSLQAVEEMVDAQNRPLWLPSIDQARPATILGKQYVIDSAIDSAASAKVPMYAGDFDQLILRNVNGMTMKRLVERYAEFGQVGFLAFMRFGVVLQDTAAIKALKCKV